MAKKKKSKWLHQFTISREVEKERTTKSTNEEGKDVKITEEELMDLCKLKNPYNRYIKNNYKRLKCFEKLNINTSRYGL